MPAQGVELVLGTGDAAGSGSLAGPGTDGVAAPGLSEVLCTSVFSSANQGMTTRADAEVRGGG